MDVIDSKIQKRLKPADGSLDVLLDRINELKVLFKEEYEQNSSFYDERDYERFMDPKDDWYARRWIIYHRDLQLAFEMLKDTMRWRKSLDLNNLTYEDFPREFYECGCVFEYGRDKKGKQAPLGWQWNSIATPSNQLRFLACSQHNRSSGDVRPVSLVQAYE